MKAWSRPFRLSVAALPSGAPVSLPASFAAAPPAPASPAAAGAPVPVLSWSDCGQGGGRHPAGLPGMPRLTQFV
jgi:hypothetical protein